MGFGLGAAIGAAVGTGERSVLVTATAASACVSELTTAVTNQVPVVILLMNNGVLGMVRQWQTLFFISATPTRFSTARPTTSRLRKARSARTARR
jgi:thiamine pyrophosphate-dependent acetolactate synthase large subunit-like protein